MGTVSCYSPWLDYFFTRDFWAELLTRNTARYFLSLPKNIDTVEVFTLVQNPNGNTNGFAGDFDSPVGTAGHVTLTGADAQKITGLWGQFPIGRKYQALCFDPVYGLQFKKRGKIYFQTSVCWHCSAFTVPVPFFGTAQYGFNAKNDDAQQILKTLENYLPLPTGVSTNSTRSKNSSANSPFLCSALGMSF
jgi:hypothetical protein